jgi:hypothetical protein
MGSILVPSFDFRSTSWPGVTGVLRWECEDCWIPTDLMFECIGL